jgi:hypothetical protein
MMKKTIWVVLGLGALAFMFMRGRARGAPVVPLPPDGPFTLTPGGKFAADQAAERDAVIKRPGTVYLQHTEIEALKAAGVVPLDTIGVYRVPGLEVDLFHNTAMIPGVYAIPA